MPCSDWPRRGKGLAFLPEIIVGSFPACGEWTVKPLRPAKLRFVLEAVWSPANPSQPPSNYLALLPTAYRVDNPSADL